VVADEVSLYNLALNAVGKRDNLTATTDKDRGAEVCNLWYPVVRDSILSAAPWPSARAIKRLAVLTENTDGADWETGAPEPGYTYAYAVPSDMLHPRFLSTYERFIITSYGSGNRALMANTQNAILTYTSRQIAVGSFEDSLALALVYGLAAHICMPLAGKPQRASYLVQQANALIAQAQADAGNFDDAQIESLPDWITARGYTNPQTIRYFYPNGNLLGMPNV